jgi:hypothetical protein
MNYEKPAVIDLTTRSEKGFGGPVNRACLSGSGQTYYCENGSTAGVGCCDGNIAEKGCE